MLRLTSLLLVKAPKLTDHNHVCEEAGIVRKIKSEMERRVMANLTARVSVIRKAVVVEYQEKYRDDLSTWNEVQVLLAEDTNIDRRLYIFKQKALKQLY